MMSNFAVDRFWSFCHIGITICDYNSFFTMWYLYQGFN
jgi:hypothetical protein